MKETTTRVLLIDDNEGDARLVREMLAETKARKYEIRTCDRLSDGLTLLAQESFDVVLLDLFLPDSQGESTFLNGGIKALKFPIIVLTGLDDEALAIKAVQAGAQDYLLKEEFNGKVLPRAIDYAIERHQLKKQIMEVSITDGLTGLYNRTGFATLAEQQIKLAQRAKGELLLFFMDVDDLKEINDNFGHQVGDRALQATADILRRTFRDSDVLGRVGGDEFVALAADSQSQGKDAILERLELERQNFEANKEVDFALSFSIGFSYWSYTQPKSLDALMSEADTAMYLHKSAKRGVETQVPAASDQVDPGKEIGITEGMQFAELPQILLVEDNPGDARLVQEYLKEIDLHYEVAHVTRLSEAVDHLQENRTALVLLDLSLPDSQGLETIEKLLEACPEIPLVVMTGLDDQDVAVKALQLGAQDYLTKGQFDEVVLSRSLKYAFERHRLNMQNILYAQELQRSEARLKSIFNNVAVGMYRTAPEGGIRFANRALVDMLGFDSFEELAGRNLEDEQIVDQIYRQEFKRALDEDGYVIGLEAAWQKADGSILFVRESAKAIRGPDGSILYYEGTAEDISAQVEVQKQLRLQSAALDAAANAIVITDLSGDILWANPAFEDLTGYTMTEVAGKNPRILKSGIQDEEFYTLFWETITSGMVWQGEMINRRKDGSFYTEQQTVAPLKDARGEITHFIAIKEDITSRKRAEEITQRQLNELKVLSAVAVAGVEETDEDALIERVTQIIGENLYSDHFGVMLLDERRDTLVIHPSYRGLEGGFVLHEIKLTEGVVGPVAATGQSRRIPNVAEVPEFIVAKSGIRSGLSVPLIVGEHVIGVLNAESVQLDDFSQEDERLLTTLAGQLATAIEQLRHQRAEKEQRIRAEALSDIALTLNSSLEFDQVLDQILDNIAGVVPHDAANILLNENGKARVARHRRLKPGSDSSWIDNQLFSIAETKNLKTMLDTGKPLIVPDVREYSGWIHLEGGEWVRSHLGVLIQKDNNTFGFLTLDHSEPGFFTESHARALQSLANQLATAMDNARLYQGQQRQLAFLESLHKIDLAITGSMNMQVTLDVVAKQVISQLGVDAASILILDPFTLSLDAVASSGFLSADIKNRSLRVGEGLGGLVAQERTTIHRTCLADGDCPECVRHEIFAKEGFHSFYGIPLISKGQIKGVMELFYRQPFEPDPEWENFAVTVATQAAIAVDNASMFENLEKSNLELSLAYDTTLEGWAKALELRDRETEGHSRRVVEMTLKLGRQMGIMGMDLVHMRRGALLHDVGKMGVPDSILQKPASLSDEEWLIMRQHPVYAFEWLSSITYLRQALDIPHYHHERWDGSGYPEGLAGEQIPLPARLFAIIDVWDALRSDRPYREAWSYDKTAAYLQEQSGSHFDPRVVEAFMKMLADSQYRESP